MDTRMNHPADERMHGIVDEAITRAVAITSLGAIALIHVLQAPTAFGETAYLGWLFLGAVLAAVILAAALTMTGDPRVLLAGGTLAGLILIGYVLSRTSGLPLATDDVGEWTEPLGLASNVFEGLLVFVAAGVAAGGFAVAGAGTRDRVEMAPRRSPGAQPGPSAG